MFGIGTSKNQGRMLLIDIGMQYVKILDFSVKKNQAKLHNFKVLNLIQGGKRFIAKEISKIIKKSVQDLGITQRLVYTSLAGKSVIVRFLEVPKMSLKELKSSLKYQSELHLPFDLNEAIFDCQILEDSAAGTTGKIKVVVAAAPKKESLKVVDIIKGAGFIPRKIDVDAIALSNAFEWGAPKDEGENIALVHIGATRTLLTIVKNRIPSLCRELNYGGIVFTEGISSSLEIDFDTAEQKKIIGEESVSKILEGAIRPLCSGLAQSFDFFEGSAGGAISKVYLSGGSAMIRGISDIIKDNLNRSVYLWDPLRSIAIDDLGDREKELLQSQSTLLTIALGMGLGEAKKNYD
jgi:type IV pilus assembly protein PilM